MPLSKTIRFLHKFYLHHHQSIVLITLLPLLVFFCAAQSQSEVFTYTKNGSQFTSASGEYAAAGHCVADETCDWIEGDQIILGAYHAAPSTWTGGTATWAFEIDIPPQAVKKAELTVSWPTFRGKGLHSPALSGEAAISINDSENVIANPSVSPDYRCPSDYFAYPCEQYSVTYPVPDGYIQNSTEVVISVDPQTAWDIGAVTLTVTGVSSTGVDIHNGQLWFDGAPFLVKGIDYAPWLLTTGPEPHHQPFPTEDDDVTAMVSNGSRLWVPDYSGDGIIQAWEVIRYDVETMAAAGVNTIRTYASGVWHDRNLNGIRESDETVQGDLPDWVYDRLLQYASDNNMKVIIGYWVQEENMIGTPPVCDWDDLEVAKQALGRVVDKYKGHAALLAWGVGNEVSGSWNHEWFTWGVGINDYLNALYAHVRTLDNGHPIMYGSYVGENAGFDNLTADLIAVNAYTHSAGDLIDAGEFDPPPAGKAYLLGEFGHKLEHAADHWDLAQQHAGGCFLEFNNVWWKPDGQDMLGIVDAYRKVNQERFEELTNLYGGPGLALCYGDSDDDGDVDGIDLSSLIAGALAISTGDFADTFGNDSCP